MICIKNFLVSVAVSINSVGSKLHKIHNQQFLSRGLVRIYLEKAEEVLN